MKLKCYKCKTERDNANPCPRCGSTIVYNKPNAKGLMRALRNVRKK